MIWRIAISAGFLLMRAAHYSLSASETKLREIGKNATLLLMLLLTTASACGLLYTRSR
jgi:hypothetical protein